MASALSLAISEAAGATTLEELGALAFPALARALDACPVFFAESAENFVESRAIAGEHGDVIPGYLREFMLDDPLVRLAVSTPAPVAVFEELIDARTLRASRAYDAFHRVYDFEHHLLVRFAGETLAKPGALSMGFTRGKRLPAFGSREAVIASMALPAFEGAARRILATRSRSKSEVAAARLAEAHGLSSAERRVLAVLLDGVSNAEIGRRLCVSLDTVKTHLQRIFRKLGAASRSEVLVRAREK